MLFSVSERTPALWQDIRDRLRTGYQLTQLFQAAVWKYVADSEVAQDRDEMIKPENVITGSVTRLKQLHSADHPYTRKSWCR